MQASTGREVVIIGPPPTPNGDLHVGHMAGPYLAADVHALLDPRSRFDPTDVLITREAQILVLPMEEYREALTRYHRSQEARWRPHLVQLARELLARPLPDFAITYPTRWGIPAPFPE